MERLKVLFVHTRFPGQFARIARHFALSGAAEVRALTTPEAAGEGGPALAGVPTALFAVPARVRRRGEILAAIDEAALVAVAAARAGARLAVEGFVPDLVYAHTGWGAGMYLREAFPRATIVKYFEWYYANRGSEADFLSPDRPLDARLLTQSLNLPVLAEFADCDGAITPTEFQRRRFPPFLRDRLAVIPDGVDVGWYAPDPLARFALPDGRVLAAGDPVVTYVARGADPVRGFRPFLEALALVQANDPAVEAVILGDDRVHYGPGAGTDACKREAMAAVRLDPARTHFLGRVPVKRYRRLLQVSAVHVHLSAPFVPSWSLFEAMAAGCLVVGSRNPPVGDTVADGVDGLLAPFADAAAIAAAIRAGLAGGPAVAAMRGAARERIAATASTERAVAAHLSFLSDLRDGATDGSLSPRGGKMLQDPVRPWVESGG